MNRLGKAGFFEMGEDPDIVDLSPSWSTTNARHGWINCGAHSIRIDLDEEGNLSIEAHARGNELQPLARIGVTVKAVREAGGIDFDNEEDEE